MDEFTHFNQDGEAIMVDVSGKKDTDREAIASGKIYMTPDCFRMVEEGKMKKGDVLGVARIAGIMAAKKTSDLIPLCHNLSLTKAELKFKMNPEESSIEAVSFVKTKDKTGVEMEALTAVHIALLTIYDMAKAVDHSMIMGEIKLIRKSGGKSGVWSREGELI
jgi:cyclic pyranopterin phosphate synthase